MTPIKLGHRVSDLVYIVAHRPCLYSIPPQPKRKFVPRIKVWKLKDPEKRAELSEVFKAKHKKDSCHRHAQ